MPDTFDRLRGTVLSIFQIGKGGPQLKNNVGALEARNAADGAFAVVRGAAPVDVSDLTTKAYVDAFDARTIERRLTATATTTATTYASLTDLSFNIGAGEAWMFELRATAQCSATTGMKYQIGGPASSALEAWVEGTTTSKTTYNPQRLTAVATPIASALHTVATTPAVDTIKGVIVAPTAGVVTFQYASVVALVTTTIFANAYLIAQRLSN